MWRQYICMLINVYELSLQLMSMFEIGVKLFSNMLRENSYSCQPSTMHTTIIQLSVHFDSISKLIQFLQRPI